MIEPNIPAHLAEKIIDLEAYAANTPMEEAFAELRRTNPLGVAQPQGFDPFWVVTKFDDIVHISKNNDLFHNGDKSTTLNSQDGIKHVMEITGGSPHLVRSLVQMDNPDHRNYRMLTNDWFMPKNLQKKEGEFRSIAKTFVNRMMEMGDELDFCKDIINLYPLHVIMNILGVPESDEPMMLRLTQELFGANDEDLNRTGEVAKTPEEITAALLGTIQEFIDYFNALTEDRRKKPQDDISTVISNGKINSEPLGLFEAMSYYIIIATAGHDTTSATVAGAMWELCNSSAQQKLALRGNDCVPGLVEESIRWVTPVKHFMRSATADTELRGHKIAKDDWLFISYHSGNRDEDAFENPNSFDLERSPNKHVALGGGSHICLGQHLARMEMAYFWEELLPKVKSIELNGEPKRMRANFVCGPKSLPIRIKYK